MNAKIYRFDDNGYKIFCKYKKNIYKCCNDFTKFICKYIINNSNH